MFLEKVLYILIFFSLLSCNAGINIEMHKFNHFNYACTLVSAGKTPSHVIYLEGYKYGKDDTELQNFALFYIKELENTVIKPTLLKIVNKKATSMDQLYGDFRIAYIHISCFNNESYISRITIYKDGKRNEHTNPKPIDKKTEVKCHDK